MGGNFPTFGSIRWNEKEKKMRKSQKNKEGKKIDQRRKTEERKEKGGRRKKREISGVSMVEARRSEN